MLRLVARSIRTMCRLAASFLSIRMFLPGSEISCARWGGAREDLPLGEVADEDEVDSRPPQDVVQGADVGALDVDPREDAGVLELLLEVREVEGRRGLRLTVEAHGEGSGA